jgi:hypothetical protein
MGVGGLAWLFQARHVGTSIWTAVPPPWSTSIASASTQLPGIFVTISGAPPGSGRGLRAGLCHRLRDRVARMGGLSHRSNMRRSGRTRPARRHRYRDGSDAGCHRRERG